jgi:hypothetical protein
MERDSFYRMINEAFIELEGSSAYRNDRKRPYDGQRHTDQGKRGKTKVKGLTFRDIKDCFVKGALLASGDQHNGIYYDKVKNESWLHSDVYELDWNKLDPIAVWQNMACEIERMMGIYPNVPKR